MVESCIHRHHALKDFYTPVNFNEVLVCTQENEYPHEICAVAVKKGSLVVRHMPRKTSAAAHCFCRL